MRRRKIASKVAVVILSAAMAMSPAISTMPVYAGDTTATEAQDNTAVKQTVDVFKGKIEQKNISNFNGTVPIKGITVKRGTLDSDDMKDLKNVVDIPTEVNADGTFTIQDSIAPDEVQDKADPTKNGKRYYYQVTEVAGDPEVVVNGLTAEVKYDTTVYTIECDYQVDNNGKVFVYNAFKLKNYSWVINDAKEPYNPIVFTNAVDAHCAGLSGHVSVSGKDLTAGEFKVRAVCKETNYDHTVPVNADGSFYFGPFTYKMEMAQKFTVTEVPGDEEGMTYDDKSYTVTITASDGGKYAKIDYSGDSTTGNDLNFVNTYGKKEIERKDISGKIVWDDDNNRDGVRPKEVEVMLKADGKAVDTVKTDTDSYTFKEKPVKDEQTGKDIVYTVGEKAIDGYKTTYDGFDITNKHETDKKDISGKITWDDEDNNDGIRPKEVEITLTADGKEVKTIKVSDSSYDFGDVPTKKDGKEIVYKVTEKEIDGYKTTYDGFDITNKHESEKITVSGRVLWDDANDNDGLRPKEVEVTLLADGKEVKTVKVSDGSFDFGKLPAKKDGKAITYKVSEKDIDGYTISYSTPASDTQNKNISVDITNKHEIKKADIPVQIVWNDKDNQDKVRPDSVTIQLTADGENYGSAVTVKEGDGWTYTWKDAPVMKNGKTVSYKVVQSAVDKYTTEASMNGQTYVFTNTHTPIEKVGVSGTVTWVDNNNKDKTRPDKVTIILTQDGKEIDRKTVSSSDSWKYDFGQRDKTDANGKAYTYAVKEADVKGYDIAIKGYDVTNTLKKSDDASKSDDKSGKTDNTTDGKSTGDVVTAVPVAVAAVAAGVMIGVLVAGKKKKKEEDKEASDTEKKEK